MRTALSISLALALTLTSGISAGQSMWVETAEDCGEWAKARKLKRSSPHEARLVGLLDGMAVGRMIEIWKAQGNPMSKEQVYSWMDKYCQANPLSRVVIGAEELANERTNGEYRRLQKNLSTTPLSDKDCAHCPEMVVIPAGQFLMGVAPGEEERANLPEEFRNRSQPQRSVNVKHFSAGRFEVTRGQYRVFAEATGRASDGCFVWGRAELEMDPAKSWRDPGYAQDDAHPVTCVSWENASAYVMWLSRHTGRKYRLFTEAEWEYAARAGTTTTRYWGDDANMTCDYANGADRSTAALVPGAGDWYVANCDDRYAYTAPVGSYRPNAFGLYDMLGNVEEWTQDCWIGNYNGAPTDGSAVAAGDCYLRVVRGGSWVDSPVGVPAAYRVGSHTTISVYRRGFRIATDM